MAQHVFVSHSTKDDAIVAGLRRALEGHGVHAWVDSRQLVAGDRLRPEIEQAISEARHFVAVLSAHAVNSTWMRDEIRHALAVQNARGDGFKVIPILLPPIEPSALGLWFGEEPLALKLPVEPERLDEGLVALLAALGLRAPDDVDGVAPAPPLADVDAATAERRSRARLQAPGEEPGQDLPIPGSKQTSSPPGSFTVLNAPVGAACVGAYSAANPNVVISEARVHLFAGAMHIVRLAPTAQ